MNARDRVSKLELLLQKIQSHARARRGAAFSIARGGSASSPPATTPSPAPAVFGAAAPAPMPIAPRSSEPAPVGTSATREEYESEAPTSALEVVDTAPIEALSEEDVVEMSSDVLESVPPPGVGPVTPPPAVVAEAFQSTDFEIEASGDDQRDEHARIDDEPPASSKRHRIASPLDDAMAFADPEPVITDDGREVPVKTPPPESGPQEAPAPAVGFGSPAPPDFDQLLGDLPPVESSASVGPSPEQLGQTIELDEPIGPSLELAPIAEPAPEPVMPEELEVTLPFGEFAGKYDAALRPPPEAREELEEHRRKSGEVLAAHLAPQAFAPDPQPSYATPESFPASEEISRTASEPAPELDVSPAPAHAEGEPAGAEHPQVVSRTALSDVSAVEFTASSALVKAPASFLELLDASIRLGEG